MSEKFQPESVEPVADVEQTPEELLALYQTDFREYEELNPEEQAVIDALLRGEMEEMGILEPISQEGENPLSSTESFIQEEVHELRVEADDTLATIPQEKQPEAKKRAGMFIKAAALGGLALFSAAQDAEARDRKVDAGDVAIAAVLFGLVSGSAEKYEIRQVEREARLISREELRSAQLDYDRTIKYIDGQLAALNNPKLAKLMEERADLSSNAEYTRQMERVDLNDPKAEEIQAKIRASIASQRAQEMSRKNMEKKDQQINLEEQRLQADTRFEERKAEIAGRYKATVESASERIKHDRASGMTYGTGSYGSGSYRRPAPGAGR